jgi:hypothetical protein
MGASRLRVKCRIVMAKAAFNDKNLFITKMDLN